MSSYFYWISAIIVTLASIVYQVLNNFGYFIDIQTINPKNYQYSYFKELLQAPEDIIRYKNQILISKSQLLDLWELKGPRNTKNGAIYGIDLLKGNDELFTFHLVSFPAHVAFHPYGKYAFQDKLYVINQAYNKGGQRIEIFQMHENTLEPVLEYKRTIHFSDEYMGTINNLIVLDNEYLIATQWIPIADPIEGRPSEGKMRDIKKTLGMALRFKQTYAYLCDYSKKDAKCNQIESTKAIMNNGITWNKKNMVFIADSLDRNVRVFKLSKSDQGYQLDLHKTLDNKGVPDNIEFDEFNNKIYIGGVPTGFGFLQLKNHFKENNGIKDDFKNWSQMNLIDLNKDELEIDIIAVLENGIRGMSSYWMYNDKIYAGSWCDKTLMLCKSN